MAMTDWDLAIETLASILRTFGEQTAELNDGETALTASQLEAWARHILFVTPPPESAAPTRGESSRIASPVPALTRGRSESGRDWDGLRRFVTQQRTREIGRVSGALTDLRASLTTFAESMAELMEASREADSLAQAQLDHLLQAIEGRSPEEIKHAVANTVATVKSLVEARQTEQEARIEALGQQVKVLTTELVMAKEGADQDPVTRLDSRRAFDEKVARAAALKRMCNDVWCLIFVRVDHLEALVDRLGRPAGDAILKRVARVLAQTFPRKGDTLARTDDTELAVILRDASLEEAQRLADRLLREVRNARLELQGEAIVLTLSIGLAEIAAGETTHRWVTRARAALSRALDDGGNRLVTREV